jgi:hypothetical protein
LKGDHEPYRETRERTERNRAEVQEDEKLRKDRVLRAVMSTAEGREIIGDVLAMTVLRPVTEREPFTNQDVAQTLLGLEHPGKLLIASLLTVCPDLMAQAQSERNDRNARVSAQLR